METLKFKTTIKCEGCVAKVTSPLNETVGQGNWEVDLKDPQKILTIKTDVTEDTIKDALSKVGYTASKV